MTHVASVGRLENRTVGLNITLGAGCASQHRQAPRIGVSGCLRRP
jgi:hypothetical protein